ncbi:MAG: hypothetical protein ACE5IK_03650 [Acidobacteriota bacterium]
MRQKLVAHLTDGEVLKGHSSDFRPNAPFFHLMTPARPVASSRRIDVDALKALFFVRSWGRPDGWTARSYRFGVGGMAREPGRRAVIRFHDGERIWGYVPPDATSSRGFFLISADPDDNNLRMFVNRRSLEEFSFLDEGSLDPH